MTKDTDSKKIKCPFCKKETSWHNNPFRPFCSERCKLTDLGEWALGKYRITADKKNNQGKK